MTAARRTLVRWGALALGVVLFFGALYYINFRTAFWTIRDLGVALPLALLFSGLWHLARTWAWAWCFPQPRTVSFARLARVRLAAEAFSYLTLRGIAGEPLKVVLLTDRIDARQATAAVALERIAYMVGTVVIVGIGSILAMAGLPLTRPWFRVFRALAMVALVLTALSGLVIAGRGTYVQSLLARVDRWLGTSMEAGRVGRFIAAVGVTGAPAPSRITQASSAMNTYDNVVVSSSSSNRRGLPRTRSSIWRSTAAMNLETRPPAIAVPKRRSQRVKNACT